MPTQRTGRGSAFLSMQIPDLSKLGPDEQREVLVLLDELDASLRSNPLQNYIPHEKQEPFHASRDPIKAFLGGNRSGKTTAGILDDLIQALPAEFVPEHLLPFKKWEAPFYCRIITPDFTSTMEGVIFQKLREWTPRAALKGGSWDKAYNKQLRKLEFDCGSWFDFLTYEQDLDKFGGAALHRVHCDEEPPGEKGRAIWHESRMRLIDYGGDIVLTMTPLLGMSWTFDEVYERRHEDGVTVVQVDMDENPHLNQEMKDEVLAGLTAEERRARKQGLFVHFAGLVYPEFSDEVHIRPPYPERQDGDTEGAALHPLASQDVIVSIDPGIRWTGITWNAFDRDNTQTTFDELLLTDRETVPELAAEKIKAKNARWGVNPWYIIDPASRNRTALGAQEDVKSAYGRAGIFAADGKNDLEAGVLEMKRRLQARPAVGWRITRNCQRILWEVGRYRANPKPDGTFDVVRKDNHELDTARYAAMSRPWWKAKVERKKRRPAYQINHEESWTGSRQTVHGPLGAFA